MRKTRLLIAGLAIAISTAAGVGLGYLHTAGPVHHSAVYMHTKQG